MVNTETRNNSILAAVFIFLVLAGGTLIWSFSGTMERLSDRMEKKIDSALNNISGYVHLISLGVENLSQATKINSQTFQEGYTNLTTAVEGVLNESQVAPNISKALAANLTVHLLENREIVDQLREEIEKYDIADDKNDDNNNNNTLRIGISNGTSSSSSSTTTD